MGIVEACFDAAEATISRGVLGHAEWAVVDDLLSEADVRALRAEAVQLRAEGLFAVSQSEKSNPFTGLMEPYEKSNVEAMQLDGGEQYFLAPRLHEYVVQAARSLPGVLNNGDIDIDGTTAANKLAVCLGDGSSYDKHFDNGGGGDTRKITALLWLNPDWKPEHGGEFRLWADDGAGREEVVDVEPRGGRLCIFKSDSLVHSVLPSFCPEGVEAEHRYALTVWIPTAAGVADIAVESAKERRHWGPHAGSSTGEEEVAVRRV